MASIAPNPFESPFDKLRANGLGAGHWLQSAQPQRPPDLKKR